MFTFTATNAIISKDYNGGDAIKISRGEKATMVRFKCGVTVYDSRCENNRRWINFTVKGFDSVASRIEAMKLHEGSHINLFGHIEQESYTRDDGQEVKAFVFYADNVEYASYSAEKKAQNGQPGFAQGGTPYGNSNAYAAPAQNGGQYAAQPAAPAQNGGQYAAQPAAMPAQNGGQYGQPAAPAQRGRRYAPPAAPAQNAGQYAAAPAQNGGQYAAHPAAAPAQRGRQFTPPAAAPAQNGGQYGQPAAAPGAETQYAYYTGAQNFDSEADSFLNN